jgi:hypothetical protein
VKSLLFFSKPGDFFQNLVKTWCFSQNMVEKIPGENLVIFSKPGENV